MPASRVKPQGPPAVRQLDQRSTASSSLTRLNLASRPMPTSAIGKSPRRPTDTRRASKPGTGAFSVRCEASDDTDALHWLPPSRFLIRKAPFPWALSSHRQQETFMITIPGQLAIKTIHGRNGDFNVGRLATSIGEFVVKNAELDQYVEGNLRGDFVIAEFALHVQRQRPHGHRIRALLGGMTLSNIDALSRDEARLLSPQEVDPIDEGKTAAKATAKPKSQHARSLVDTRRSAVNWPAAAAEASATTLPCSIWPLGAIVKLTTPSIAASCQQRDRLGVGLRVRPRDWHLASAAPGFHHPRGFLPGIRRSSATRIPASFPVQAVESPAVGWSHPQSPRTPRIDPGGTAIPTRRPS